MIQTYSDKNMQILACGLSRHGGDAVGYIKEHGITFLVLPRTRDPFPRADYYTRTISRALASKIKNSH